VNDFEVLKKGYIQIPIKEYNKLCRDSDFLNCLERAGVDNWDGYEFALEDYQEDSE